MKLRLPAFILAGVCAAACSARAQFVWTGSVDNQLASGANWEGPSAPTGVGTENLQFGAGGLNTTNIYVPASPDIEVNNLTFNGTTPPAYSFNGDGSTLVLNGNVTVGAGHNVSFLGGLDLVLASGNHVLDVAGTATLLVNSAVSGAGGGITKLGTGSLTFKGIANYTGNTIVSFGTLAIDGSEGGALGDSGANIGIGINAGDSATLSLINGATVLSLDGLLGAAASSTGTAMVAGGSWTNSGNLIIGQSGTGNLVLTSGGQVIAVNATVAHDALSAGTVTISNEARLTTAGVFTVGRAGMGILTVSGGGEVKDLSMGAVGNVGLSTGGTGTVAIGGNSSKWQILSGALNVGVGGTGTLTVSGGGLASASEVNVGVQSGSVGTVGLTNSGSALNVTGRLYVGLAGAGTLTVIGGAAVASDFNAYIGFDPGSLGAVTLDGAGSVWTHTGDLYVGNSGTGLLTLSNGGLVQNNVTKVAFNSGSSGTISITGVGSAWTMSNDLFLGFGGIGIVTVGDGAQVNVNSGSGTVTLGSMAGSSGTLNLGGSAAGVAAAGGVLNANAITTGAGTGVLQFNTTGTSGAPYFVTNDGTNSGTPILILGGTQLVNTAGVNVLKGANTYTGGTLITGGTLQLGAPDALPATGSVHITSATANSTATFDLNGFAQTIGPLTLAGATATSASQVNIGAGGTLTLGGNVTFDAANNPPAANIIGGTLALGGTRTFDIGFSSSPSADLVISSSLSGAGFGLIKTGAGTLYLNGPSTYTGGSTINRGTLLVSTNALASTGNVTVNATTAGTTASFQLNASSTQTIGALTFGGAGATSTSINTVSLGTGTLTLGGNVTYDATNHPLGATISGGTLALGGNRTFDVGNSTNVSLSELLISSVISGAGAGLTKTGAGRLTLTGANTYTGVTTVNGGILSIGNEGTTGSVAGDIVNNATLWFFRSNNLSYGGIISGTGGVTKFGAGTLTLTGANTYTGSTQVSAGTLVIGATNTLPTGGAVSTLSGTTIDVQNDQTVGALTGSGSVVLANGKTFTVANTGSTSFAGILSGGGAFTKRGAGTFTITGANAYSGGTTIHEGRLTLGANHALPAGGNLLLLSSVLTSEFDVGAFSQTIGSLTLGGTGAAAAARHRVFISAGGTLTLGGDVTFDATNNPASNVINGPGTLALGATRTFAIGDSTQSGLDLAISATISGPGFNLIKTGAGSLGLTGVNTFTGATTINGGILSIDSDASLGAAPGSATAAHLVIDGGTLQTTATFALHSNRGISLGANGGTFSPNSATTLTYGGVIAGSGALVKAGAGTLTLTGANTYGGGTTISAGNLIAGHASALGTNAITLNGGTLALSPGVALNNALNFGASGGTISGNGTFGSAINAGSNITLAPGDSPGTTTFTSTLTWAPGGSYNLEILSATGGVPGVSYDTLVIAGAGSAFNITATSAGKFNLNLLSLSASTTPGNVSDFSASNSYSWQIASSTNPIVGFSADAFAINTTGFTNSLGIGSFGVSINGSNTALFLNFTPIPEPSTYVLMAFGAGALLFISRRRRS